MRKIADYQMHAEECRMLARNATLGEHRDQLLKMAQAWQSLAEERERSIKRGVIDPQD